MAGSKEVEISYFAVFRDKRGVSSERRQTSAHTLRQLYAELATAYGFALPVDRVRVAVADEFTNWDRVVQPGDRIVFIPPVAGG